MCLTRRAAFILDSHLPLPYCLTGFVRGARILFRNFVFPESPGRQYLREKSPKTTANCSAVCRNIHFAAGGQFLMLYPHALGSCSAGTLAGFCANKGKWAAHPESEQTKLPQKSNAQKWLRGVAFLFTVSVLDVGPAPGRLKPPINILFPPSSIHFLSPLTHLLHYLNEVIVN